MICVIHDYKFLHTVQSNATLISVIWNIVTNITHFEKVGNAYRQVSNISSTLVGNQIVDHSDVVVVGASPVGAAPTTSSFST